MGLNKLPSFKNPKVILRSRRSDGSVLNGNSNGSVLDGNNNGSVLDDNSDTTAAFNNESNTTPNNDNHTSSHDWLRTFNNSHKIYLRDTQISLINDFLFSEKNILQVIGNPGTGKTKCVLYACNKNVEYINYLMESNIKERIRKTKKKVIVIDEFDRYFNERRKECMEIVSKIKKKAVLISNTYIGFNILKGSDRVVFEPYSIQEIRDILSRKMDEVGRRFVDEKCIEFLCKKYEKEGDMRKIVKEIVSVYSNTNVIGDHSDNNVLTIRDFIKIEKKPQKGIHQEIISKIKETESNKENSYGRYLNECEEIEVDGMNRGDFETVFDLM